MITSTADIVALGYRHIIPLAQGLAYTRQRVTLDGRAFMLDLAWNTRGENWFISLSDAEDVPIISGLLLTPNWPLLRFSKWDPRCPPGELVAQDDGTNADINFDDIGGDNPRVQLVYYGVEP